MFYIYIYKYININIYIYIYIYIYTHTQFNLFYIQMLGIEIGFLVDAFIFDMKFFTNPHTHIKNTQHVYLLTL